MSLIEVVVVLVVLSILTAISIPLVYNNARKYKSEDQAIKIMDLMRETAQLAMNQRRTMRFEIDWSIPARPLARVIDENGAAPDVILKTVPLEPSNEVRMDRAPTGIGVPVPPNFPALEFAGVISARFRSDGSVVNAADLPISGTLYSWPPKNEPYNPNDLVPRRVQEVRAVTLSGAGGAIRFWRWDGNAFVAWQ